MKTNRNYYAMGNEDDAILIASGTWENEKNSFLYRNKYGGYVVIYVSRWEGEEDRVVSLSLEKAIARWKAYPNHYELSFEEAFPNAYPKMYKVEVLSEYRGFARIRVTQVYTTYSEIYVVHSSAVPEIQRAYRNGDYEFNYDKWLKKATKGAPLMTEADYIEGGDPMVYIWTRYPWVVNDRITFSCYSRHKTKEAARRAACKLSDKGVMVDIHDDYSGNIWRDY